MLRLLALLAVTLLPPAASALASPRARLDRGLGADMHHAGGRSGAYVYDLTAGRRLYTHHIRRRRIPASVEKLYTSTTALKRLGPDHTFITRVLTAGTVTRGVVRGPVYLRGDGDPTFGDAAYDGRTYHTGATVQSLAAQIKAAGIRRIDGPIVGDESKFDTLRGAIGPGYVTSPYAGPLSGLSFDHELLHPGGCCGYVSSPARTAAGALRNALRHRGIRVRGRVSVGTTPPGAAPLAAVPSPPLSTIIDLMDGPSDNFFAETLLKDIGAQAGRGSTRRGAAVVRDTMRAFDLPIHPRIHDGSGLSRHDRTSPRAVVNLLREMASDQDLVGALPILGRTGTLAARVPHSRAAGHCQAKTGTLHDVSAVAGYCHARDGHTLVFALLMNRVNVSNAHLQQDRAMRRMFRYNG